MHLAELARRRGGFIVRQQKADYSKPTILTLEDNGDNLTLNRLVGVGGIRRILKSGRQGSRSCGRNPGRQIDYSARNRVPGKKPKKFFSMIKVQVRPNESLEAALRRFKRQCNQSGLFTSMKERSFFTKPTTARRLEKKERIQTIKRAERIRRNARF